MSKQVTTKTFGKEVLEAEKAVLVDFWAPWCAPCRQMAPVLDNIARDMEGDLEVAKVNVDEEPDLAGRYGVQGIPTLLIFQGGKVIAQHVGAAPQRALQDALKRLLGVA